MQIERKNDRESKCISRKRKSDRYTERKEVLDKKRKKHTERKKKEREREREKDNECERERERK